MDVQNKVWYICIVHTMNVHNGFMSFVLQSGDTALTSASASGSVEVVELLLKANAEIELEKMVRTTGHLFYQQSTVPVQKMVHHKIIVPLTTVLSLACISVMCHRVCSTFCIKDQARIKLRYMYIHCGCVRCHLLQLLKQQHLSPLQASWHLKYWCSFLWC